MAKRFDELRERLLQAGVAQRHVRRYLSELGDHQADLIAEEERTGRTLAEAEAAALLRLGDVDSLADAMTGQPQLRSWSARAPWAVFGIGSLALLVVAYLIACLYLWIIWQAFLPGAETPFGHRVPGPIYGLVNISFQAGKLYYLSAPILVGWIIEFVAARQRIKAAWPIAAALLLALVDSTAQIHASLKAIPYGHIRMNFVLESSMRSLHAQLVAALLMFALTIVPYLLWRISNALTHRPYWRSLSQ